MKPVRVAVIGCGYWGPLHVRVFSAMERSVVPLVVDLNEQRLRHLAALYPTLRTSTNLAEAMAQDIDAAVVATPAGTHYAIASALLRAGKHVLVEKPLTTRSADAEHLNLLAASGGVTLMCGHTFVFHPAVRALRDTIASGELGSVRYIDSVRVNLGLHRKDVDVLWDLGAHDVAILRYLLGEEAEPGAVYGARFQEHTGAEVAYAELRYPSGVLANLRLSWLDPVKIRRMTVVGSDKMAVWDDLEETAKLRIHDRGMNQRPYYDDFGQWQVAYRDGETRTPEITWVEPLHAQAQHFLDCILTGATPLSGGSDGLAVVRTLEQCSARLRL